MKSTFLMLMLVTLLLPAPAHAVRLAHDEAGQVGIVPLFNTNGGMDTLLKISNGPGYSAVRIQFRDLFGDRRKSLNVYLAPREAWRAAVGFSFDGPRLNTTDTSCVLEADESALVSAEKTEWLIERPQGYIEVLLMGHIEALDLRTAVESRECDDLVDAFSSGTWSLDGNTGMSAPTDSIRVHSQNIIVERGILYGLDAVHLQQFRDQPFHVAPSEPFGLADAHDAGTDIGATRSLVCDGDCIIQTWADPRDAVASLLLTGFSQLDYSVNPDIGAATSVVVINPMHPYYAAGEFAEHGAYFYLTDSDAGLLTTGPCEGGPLPTDICFPPLGIGFPKAQSTFTMSVLDEPEPVICPCPPWRPPLPAIGTLGSYPITDEVLDYTSLDRLTSGSVILVFWNADDPGPSLISNEGNAFAGSPAIAVAFTEFVNGQLVSSQGNPVIANYGSAQYARKTPFVEDNTQ